MSGINKHNKETGTYFCSVTHDLILADEMKKVLPDFKSWAWIYHEPDNEDGTPHVHFLVRANGTRNIKQIAEKLGIESNYVQVCRKVVAFRRYMLHLDSDDKKKYEVSQVHTNNHADFRAAANGNVEKDIYALYQDYVKLQNGYITIDEFIQLNFVELSKMPFYQKIKIFDILTKSVRITT